MNIRKGKVYHYYCLFKQGLTVEEIYSTYKQNKQCYRRKERVLSKQKLKKIHELLDQGWLLDTIVSVISLWDIHVYYKKKFYTYKI